MNLNLPAGVTSRQDLEVAPKSQPMSTEGMAFLAAQKRREAEEMDAIVARRQEAEQAEIQRIRAEGEAKARIAEEKRQKAEEERQKWAAINSAPMPSGWLQGGAAWGFNQVVVADKPLVPMLVGDELVIHDLGLTLETFELVSPVVPQASADMLRAVYEAEAVARFRALVDKAVELLGDGPWLYTSCLPVVAVEDAGPISQHTDRPSHTHKQIRATWGDCYIHNPNTNKD